jgi:hypothetical protein
MWPCDLLPSCFAGFFAPKSLGQCWPVGHVTRLSDTWGKHCVRGAFLQAWTLSALCYPALNHAEICKGTRKEPAFGLKSRFRPSAQSPGEGKRMNDWLGKGHSRGAFIAMNDPIRAKMLS